MASKELIIDTAAITRGREAFKAPVQKDRFKILKFLHANGPTRVTTIYKKLKMEQSRTSANLAILKQHGIITGKREGAQVFYSINYSRLREIIIYSLMFDGK